MHPLTTLTAAFGPGALHSLDPDALYQDNTCLTTRRVGVRVQGFLG